MVTLCPILHRAHMDALISAGLTSGSIYDSSSVITTLIEVDSEFQWTDYRVILT